MKDIDFHLAFTVKNNVMFNAWGDVEDMVGSYVCLDIAKSLANDINLQVNRMI
jgi:hypothetical protein